MTMMNQFRIIARNFHQPLKTLAAGAMALGLCLFAGAGNARATPYLWTNTTSDVWEDPNAWSPIGVPGVSDTATFNAAATHSVTLTADVVTAVMDVTVTPINNAQTLTVNLGGNSLSLFQPGSSSPTALFWGDASGGTNTIFFASSTGIGKGLFVTNAASLRATIGRSGWGVVNVTNGFVQVGINGVGSSAVVLGNNPGPASRGILILSGSSVVWSNYALMSVGNNAGAFLNSLVISNSASLYQVGGALTVGAAVGSSNNILLDTGGRMLVSSNGSTTVGLTTGVGNKITVQGNAVWDNGGKVFSIGGVGGNSNLLTVGSSGLVTNLGVLNIAAGNFLTLSNGFLQVTSPGAVTNAAATITGFGTIAGNVVFTGTGTLTPGFGTSVGTLTLSNNLTLASGSTVNVKLDKGQAGSNDLINVVGTLAEAGTLTINNVGAALVGGDTFKIFSGTPSGHFNFIGLPALTGTLVWNTNQLGSQGIISVVLPVTITGPNPQAVLVASNVVISTVVTGVPAASLQWQFDGVNLSDGATTNGGSSISGSTSSTLTISDAQLGDSGQYCLIANNIAGPVTNCMILEVTTNTAAPLIGGPTDQNVISPNSATFTAVVVGIPTPTQQWQDNGVNILNETNTTLVIPGVTFALDGHVYCIIASNSVGTATNCAALHVVVPPVIQTQPVSLVVTQTQSATFTVVSTNGVPAPTYQWFFNNVSIPGATNVSYTIASAAPANDGNYNVVVANVAGYATSSNATLTINSTMTASLTPTNGATAVCYDTPLYMLFSRTPVETGAGKINIYDSTNSVTPVDTIDTSAGNLQPRTIGTETFNTFPIIITGNTVAIYPHLDLLSSNQTYYVTVDPGTFAETNGAFFAGITSSNAWQFTTKSAPANPNNLVVATDNSGDFATVQGAVDSLPTNNLTPTLVTIRNGTYTEVVDTKGKNNITFRGQSRTGTVVGYANNNVNNNSTHSRMAFKIFANDLAIENMTVVNTTPQGGSQAEAIMIDTGAARFILNNAEVDSRQDTILANVNSSQGYFYNSLVQGNFDYIWGGGNLFFTNCELRTIPTASSYNLTAPRTDNGATGNWLGPDGNYASNGLAFVNCLLTKGSNSITSITMSDANGSPDGVSAFINCKVDPAYTNPTPAVIASQILWEFGNSNLTSTAAETFGLTVLTNGDARLLCASSATCWLNGWVPQLAPNILTNPVSQTVTAGVSATFNVVATGIPTPNYQWLKNGATITGQTSPTLIVSSAACGDAGTYSVIVSNIAGSVTSSNATLTVIGTAPVTSFTAAPIVGTEPLGVTFQDTSTSSSSPLSILWNFGDLTSTITTGGATVVHTYAAGTYTVTLAASNACSTSTIVSNNLITVYTAFQAWQIQYFGSTTNPAAAANADPDGDGLSNLAEFLSGTDPTNSASGLHITYVTPSGSDVVVTWATAGGTTNVVQSTAGDGNGGYSTNFTDLSGLIIITGSGDTSTNYTDVGGATNSPARYYRVRLAP
jgi:PKD repeat protein